MLTSGPHQGLKFPLRSVCPFFLSVAPIRLCKLLFNFQKLSIVSLSHGWSSESTLYSKSLLSTFPSWWKWNLDLSRDTIRHVVLRDGCVLLYILHVTLVLLVVVFRIFLICSHGTTPVINFLTPDYATHNPSFLRS